MHSNSAQWAAIDNRYVELAELAMSLVGLELASSVKQGERAAFAVSVQVDLGSKLYPGAVLVLEHRVVVAWSEGILRPTPHSMAAKLGDVSDVETSKRKTRAGAQLDVVSFVAAERKVALVLAHEVIIAVCRAAFVAAGSFWHSRSGSRSIL